MSKINTSLLTICLFLMTSIHFGYAMAGKDHSHATESEDEAVRNKALTSKIWWNQKRKVSELKLTEDQRHDMDHALGDYLSEFTKHSVAQKEAFKALGEALKAGDSKKAEAQRTNLSTLTSTSVDQQIAVMIKVVAYLTEEQRTTVANKYPALFSRLWLKSANPASLQMGRTETKGMRKKKNK